MPGATVHYTITITNTGQTPYTAITVADSLAGLLDDAAYNGDATATTGTVSYASPSLTWTGSLAPGATATVTFSATVNNPDTGEPGPGHPRHLGRGRQQLHGRQHRPQLRHHRPGGAGRAADHERQLRRRLDGRRAAWCSTRLP